jgi:multiple sugar transport system permease protein
MVLGFTENRKMTRSTAVSKKKWTAAPLRRRRRRMLISLLLLVIIGIWSLAPVVWVGITSIKTQGTENRRPVVYWPENPTVENYRTVLDEPFRIQRSIWNSIVVSTGALVGTLTLSLLSAYAIARLKFRYRYASLLYTQIAGMVPPIVVIGPTFVLLRSLGLLRTYWAMILPNMAYGIPLSTWLIASYFSHIPFSIEDAARIDGCGPVRTVLYVMLPIAAPGIFSAGVLVFLGSWGEFMLAFTTSIGNALVQTVPVTVLSLSQAFELQWAWVSAATIITLLPLLAMVMIFQRYVIAGLSGVSLQ